MERETVLIICGIYFGVMSLLAFVLYGVDKGLAKGDMRRIPEKVLLLISFLGGALGGNIGMSVFRHKTRGEHWYFRAINIAGLIIHVALVVCVAFVFKF